MTTTDTQKGQLQTALHAFEQKLIELYRNMESAMVELQEARSPQSAKRSRLYLCILRVGLIPSSSATA